jgi:hypothetical protein
MIDAWLLHCAEIGPIRREIIPKLEEIYPQITKIGADENLLEAVEFNLKNRPIKGTNIR